MNFSIATYRATIEAALQAGYRFLAFDDERRHVEPRVCLLRHDVDADMEAAARMAELEAHIGVRSTYFLMLRSPVYNLFSRANHALARAILDCSHFIGLHFDQGFLPGEHKNTRDWILYEAEVLSSSLNAKVNAVSFHQPSQEVLEDRVDTGRLVNTYSRAHLQGFDYVSDSNRNWRTATPLEIFRQHRVAKLHLLIHPMWWVHEQPSTADVWDSVLLGNFARSQNQLVNTERAYGPSRTFIIRRSPGG